MKQRPLLLNLILCSLFTSCNIIDPAEPETRKSILGNGKWHPTGETYHLPSGDSTDNMTWQRPCDLDNYISFLDHSYFFIGTNQTQYCFGTLKCDPSEPDCDSSFGEEWNISDSQDTLYLGGRKFTFVKLDCHEMILSGVTENNISYHSSFINLQ